MRMRDQLSVKLMFWHPNFGNTRSSIYMYKHATSHVNVLCQSEQLYIIIMTQYSDYYHRGI